MLDLIEGKLGIVDLLDEQCRFPTATARVSTDTAGTLNIGGGALQTEQVPYCHSTGKRSWVATARGRDTTRVSNASGAGSVQVRHEWAVMEPNSSGREEQGGGSLAGTCMLLLLCCDSMRLLVCSYQHI